MKKKTFFATLALFILFFNCSILGVSFLMLRDQFSAVRERCLAEHFVIATALINDIKVVEDRGEDVDENMDNLMSPYTRYSQNKTMLLSVSKDNSWIYQTPEDAGSLRTILETPVEDTERTVFVRGRREPVLYIYGRFPSPYSGYGLLYSYNLTEMTRSWRSFKNSLFAGGILITTVLALCLLFLLDRMFRPFQQVAEASREIASGHYEKRLPVLGRDETAAVAESFNRMAGEIENRIAQLEAAASQKQQFVDNFAHELRTPLTAIYGYAEYLQKAAVTEEENYSSTQFIMTECRRLQNMAYQLLDLASMRRSGIPMSSFPAKELFLASRNVMRQKADERGIRLEYSSPRHSLYGSRELLESLLNNLVDNALKASPAGSAVRITSYLSDGAAVIRVEDEGIGMEEDTLSHITEAFYRADKARSRGSGGAGLGLSLCEKIARLHSARLTFTSAPGKGTAAELKFTSPQHHCNDSVKPAPYA